MYSTDSANGHSEDSVEQIQINTDGVVYIISNDFGSSTFSFSSVMYLV